jgi:hypothetical protein
MILHPYATSARTEIFSRELNGLVLFSIDFSIVLNALDSTLTKKSS